MAYPLSIYHRFSGSLDYTEVKSTVLTSIAPRAVEFSLDRNYVFGVLDLQVFQDFCNRFGNAQLIRA
jgi:hypothetical protein